MSGIIVGVDESSYSRAALRWAVDVGAIWDRPVTAVMAWDYLSQPHVDPDAEFDPSYSGETAAKVLDQLVGAAVGDQNDVACVVVCDRAGRALLDASAGADLVVVGARGMSGFKGLLLGSVSRHVLHAATVPVAVIRDDADRSNHPVVVGVDGSEPSRRALAWALRYAGASGSKLVAIHTWEYPSPPLGLIGPPERAEFAARGMELLTSELAGFEGEDMAAEIERRTREGRAGAVLLDAGAIASMIVVGSRGRGAFASTMLGSVSDQISQHATCPVIVVP